MAFLKYFWLNSSYLANNYFGKSYNNWGSYATLAVYCLCAFYPEFAVSHEWFEAIKIENERLNTNFALEDGSCIELGQGYIHTLLGTLSGPIKVYDLTRVELPYSDYVWNKIHKAVECYYITLAPGYGGFNLGDSMDANGVARQRTISTLKYWASVFPNDKYLEYFATEGKTGSLPDYTSISYPLGLRTFIRSDWSDKALALEITAKREASHGHKDVMSLAMYAYGKYLLTYSSYGAILTGETRDYMISAKQHNVVTANEKDQSVRLDGRLDAVEITDSYDYVRYSPVHIPDMECYTRSVLFLKEQKFWIVSDYIKPTSYTEDNFYEQH